MKARDQFKAAPDQKIVDADAAAKPVSNGEKSKDKDQVSKLAAQIAEYQNKLYAERRCKLLVILQGMDTSGKDGTITGVFGQIDPIGVRCIGFKAPTQIELEHDYLWRIHKEVPGKGELIIFNRSHYEDVVITRVHGLVNEEECQRRYAQINEFERMLTETGTVILKFFLHISKEEQKQRLQERLDNPDKHWKFDPNDLKERQFWEAYQSAYQDAIQATNSKHAPWYIIPADSKTHRNLAIAQIVLETMESMKLSYPPSHPEYTQLQVK